MPLPDPIDMVRALIAAPSVSSDTPELDLSNRRVVDLLAGWVEAAGGTARVHAIPGLPGKTNLIGTFGPRDTGEPAAVLLSGHTDTVPCDAERWSSDPFVATARDDRLYGLGSADMKSFLALSLAAIERVGAHRLRCPVVLLATADEETTMAGARALVHDGAPLAHRAIIGEPTDMRPIALHKGLLALTVTIVGKSGHGSDPARGRNAIDGLHGVLGALFALREGWMERYFEPAFEVPTPTMSFGRVTGGDAFNRICGRLQLGIDVRIVPGMDPAAVRASIEACARESVAGRGFEVSVTEGFEPVPAFDGSGTEWLSELERRQGHTHGAVMFGTEAPFLQALGMAVVVMGPGSISVAHQPDEFLPLAQVEPTIALLCGLVHDFGATEA